MSHIRDILSKCTSSKERKITLKEIRSYIDKENKTFSPLCLTEIPLPDTMDTKNLLKAYRSRHFLVQVYSEEHAVARITVNRSEIKDDGNWVEGISWDALMWVKKQAGYGDYEAVEVYPKDDDVVNVANIRHLFVLKDSLPFTWKDKESVN